MRWTAFVACAILGALFAMLENYLYQAGIGLDSLLSSVGASLTITDFMILTFLAWCIVGLWLSMAD